MLGKKLGAGEGLLPTARIAWMPPGALMPVVDHLPWALKLLGPQLPTPLLNTSSVMWQIFGNKAALQVFSWRRSLVAMPS